MPAAGRLAATMAEHLASIFGTEKDRVNCPFYFKIGCVGSRGSGVMAATLSACACFDANPSLVVSMRRACRHGDRCSRLHNKPATSQTILLQNMYSNPVLNAPIGPDGLPMPVDPEDVQEHYEVRAPGRR